MTLLKMALASVVVIKEIVRTGSTNGKLDSDRTDRTG
jgi:hypothetical protein